jgi:aminoglycoside phosphotransferase (APT) family kinase protein
MEPATEMHRSSRDPARLRVGLAAWLARTLPGGASPAVLSLEGTSANGMSSETLLFDAEWHEGGATRAGRLVARLAPDAEDVPVFPRYDLEKQFDVLRLVGELTRVPVPPVRWYEPDPAVLGTPFFVMDRVDGQVPPDVMPYNFGDSWLYDASPSDQRRLQDATVDVLAELHRLRGDDPRFAFLADDPSSGATPLRRHVARTTAWYRWCAGDDQRSSVVERCIGWLEERFPADESEAVVCWGDSRIGNCMYRDFAPVGVLDWEMACLGPRELDVCWLVYAHRVFEDFAKAFESGGMPGFLRFDDVVARYESATGTTLRDLDWYCVYAALQFAIVFLRTGQRQVHFGEKPKPDDADELVMNADAVESMLAGTYW